MRHQVACLAVSLTAATFSAAPAAAAITVFASPLTPEVPGATGAGMVQVTYDSSLRTLAIFAEWAGLSGTTTVAHIHCCVDPPGNVGVAVTPGTLPGFPTGLQAGNYSILLDLTQTATYTGAFLTANGGTAAGAEGGLFAGMQAGRAYFNVHTTAFPGGEIRGFLTAVPEPATWAMLIAGFGVLGGAMRRRQRLSQSVRALA
jgi:hypothetical protein